MGLGMVGSEGEGVSSGVVVRVKGWVGY